LKKYQTRGGKDRDRGGRKASAKREREVAASGATPLDKMLRSMRLLLALQVTLRRLADEYQMIADELEDEGVSTNPVTLNVAVPGD
jgi:hypothetical protein